MPGGVGMLSTIRTSARPLTRTPVLASGPIISGYGTPLTELIIMQIEPLVANGIPPAVMNGGSTVMIVPLSGGPAAPGRDHHHCAIADGGAGHASLLPLAGENDVMPWMSTIAPCSVPAPPSTVAPMRL